jgi:hypothetical protein
MKLQHRSRCALRCTCQNMKAVIAGIIAVLLTLLPAALATDANLDLIPAWPETKPPKREWPPGPLQDYLHNLQRPDNGNYPERDKYSRTCCDAGDTVKTKFKVEPGDGRYPEDRWYAWLNEKWVPIPPDKIVQSYAPDGEAYLFMMDFATDFDNQPMFKVIVCFVRPKGGL